MKFMIMVFGDEATLHIRAKSDIEREAAFMVQFEDELATGGELVYSEVLEFGASGTLVEAYGGTRRGSFSTLLRYWVVRVPAETRAIELAARVASVTASTVEVRQCMEQSTVP
ncbi:MULTISPECIES: YciI family protein [unclassified Diaminobutyricimonas]|uniref:YciI family protein n=1 Tax=unclassified Diaminobutyricimonas TaxID=2643261 RepID=UPI0012F4F105|nr:MULTISPECIES: YciI family protein [unclassified Diaminobutyricimonas]